MAERQLRHDGQLFVDIEQLVADRGEDDARGIGALQHRVEHVGVIAQPDAQVALRQGTPGDKRKSKCQGGTTSCLSHVPSVMSG